MGQLAIQIFTFLTFFLSLTSALLELGAVTEDETIAFGSTQALSLLNPKHSTAVDAINAWTLFFDMLNSGRGGINVGGRFLKARIVVNDDNADANDVQIALGDLIQDKAISLLLGPWDDSLIDSAVNAVKNTETVLLHTNSEASITSPTNNSFSLQRPEKLQLANLVNTLTLNSTAKLALLLQPGLPPICSNSAITYATSNFQTLSTFAINALDSDATVLATAQNVKDYAPDLIIGCMDTALSIRYLQAAASLSFSARATVLPASDISAVSTALGDRALWVLGQRSGLGSAGVALDLWTGIVGSDIKQAYEARFARPFTTLAAYTFALGEVVVKAIEVARSVNAIPVATALRSLRLQTVIGPIVMANGTNTATSAVVQVQADALKVVYPPALRERSLIYPAPSWQVRNCTLASSSLSSFGYTAAGVCTLCSSGQEAIFDAKSQRRVCRNCPAGRTFVKISDTESHCFVNCKDGFVESLKTFKCTACPVGNRMLETSDGPMCAACPMGTFSGSFASTKCTVCEPGKVTTIEGQSVCSNCAPGRFAAFRGSTRCEECGLGRLSDAGGSSFCRLCPEGKVANITGRTKCEMCLPGQFSVWGAVACAKCPIGRYQSNAGQTECIADTEGVSSPRLGTSIPNNAQGYYTLVKPSLEGLGGNASFETCELSEEACLANARCAAGTTGRQCFSCLPGYYRNFQDGVFQCLECDPLWTNVVTFCFGFILEIIILTIISRTIIQAGGKEISYYAPLLKLLLNHSAAMVIISSTIRFSVVQKMTPGDPYLESVLMVLKFLMWTDGASPDRFTCMLQPTLLPSEQLDINRLAASLQSQFLNADLSSARALLENFQRTTLLRSLVWWAFFPLLLVATIGSVGFLALSRHLSMKRPMWPRAMEFYSKVYYFGLDFAMQSLEEKKELEPLVETYSQTIWGIYWPILHLRSNQSSIRTCCGCRKRKPAEGATPSFVRPSFRSFTWESITVAYVVLYIGHVGHCRKLFSGLQCVTIGEDGSYLATLSLYSQGSVRCSLSELSLWVSVFFGCIGTFGFPIAMLWGLRRNLDVISTPRMIKRWAVMINGYQKEFWWWEGVIFARKACLILIETGGAHPGFQSMLLVTGLLFLVIQIAAEPFDGRGNGILNTMEKYGLWIWVITSSSLNGIDLIRWMDVEVGARILYMLAFMLFLHLGFSFMLIFYIAKNMSVTVGSKLNAKWVSEMKSGYAKRLWRALFITLFRFKRMQPYLAYDPRYAWVSVLGSRGDKAIPPLFPSGRQLSDMENLECAWRIPLSLLPTVSVFNHTNIRPLSATTRDRKTVYQYLMSTIEHISCGPGSTSTFSVSSMEFVIRAAHVIAASNRKDDDVGVQDVDKNTWRQANITRDLLTIVNSKKEGMESFDTLSERLKRLAEELQESLASSKDLVLMWEASDKCRRLLHLARKEGRKVTLDDFELTEEQLLEKEADDDSSVDQMILTHFVRDAQESIVSKYKEKIDAMFEPLTFKRGLNEEEFQLALSALQKIPRDELKVWLDMFEKQWLAERIEADLDLRSLVGSFVEKGTQAKLDATSMVEDQLQTMSKEAVIEGLLRANEIPLKAALNWARFVVLRVHTTSYHVSLKDLNDVRRQRRQRIQARMPALEPEGFVPREGSGGFYVQKEGTSNTAMMTPPQSYGLPGGEPPREGSAEAQTQPEDLSAGDWSLSSWLPHLHAQGDFLQQLALEGARLQELATGGSWLQHLATEGSWMQPEQPAKGEWSGSDPHHGDGVRTHHPQGSDIYQPAVLVASGNHDDQQPQGDLEDDQKSLGGWSEPDQQERQQPDHGADRQPDQQPDQQPDHVPDEKPDHQRGGGGDQVTVEVRIEEWSTHEEGPLLAI